MNLDQGKKLYSTYSEAKSIADRMCRTHNEGFNVYKVNEMWAVGGVHAKLVNRKRVCKSLNDIRLMFADYSLSEDDRAVANYISEVDSESQTNESWTEGESEDWILESVDLKLGREIGMSESNTKTYLVLKLSKNSDEVTLKMGGKFSPHIPLLKRHAENLKGQAVIWHTWNSKIKETSWSSDSWFYLIESKNQHGDI